LRHQNVLWAKKNYKKHAASYCVLLLLLLLYIKHIPNYLCIIILYRGNTVRSVTRKKKIRIYATSNACGRWALLPSFAEHGYQLLFIYILFFFLILILRTRHCSRRYIRVKSFTFLYLSLSLFHYLSASSSLYPTISMSPPQILLWT